MAPWSTSSAVSLPRPKLSDPFTAPCHPPVSHARPIGFLKVLFLPSARLRCVLPGSQYSRQRKKRNRRGGNKAIRYCAYHIYHISGARLFVFSGSVAHRFAIEGMSHEISVWQSEEREKYCEEAQEERDSLHSLCFAVLRTGTSLFPSLCPHPPKFSLSTTVLVY